MQHIVLSPHYDDAALSCGGMIAQRSAASDPVVVATLFGGQPDPATLSPFARSIHARPGAGDDLLAQRRAEERAALAILAAQPRPGDYLDCIYRQEQPGGRWLYASEEAIFGALDRADAALEEELAAAVAALAPIADCTIYAPLAIGSHVDHQLTRKAARRLLEAGYPVRFYEDYPYAARDAGGLAAALQAGAPGGRWQPVTVALDRRSLDVKIAAVAAYTSQLDVLFGAGGRATPREVAAALDGFARLTAHAAGASGWAERLWTRT